MEENEYRFAIREFLNKTECYDNLASVGAWITKAEITEGYKGSKTVDLDAHIQISDCNKSIQLDFDFYPGISDFKEDNALTIQLSKMKNNLEKASRLAEVVAKFRDALGREYEIATRMIKKIIKENKRKEKNEQTKSSTIKKGNSTTKKTV